MRRAPIFLFFFFFLVLSFGVQTTYFFYPFPLSMFPYLDILCYLSFQWLFFLMKHGTVIERMIRGLFRAPENGGFERGLFVDFLSTLIQLGPLLCRHTHLSVTVYTSTLLLILVVFMDLFAPRQDTTVIVRKVSKRCVYSALILFYQWRIFHVNLGQFVFALPGAFIPLVPAIFAGFIEVYCANDLPQHRVIPNWFGWRRLAHLEAHID